MSAALSRCHSAATEAPALYVALYVALHGPLFGVARLVDCPVPSFCACEDTLAVPGLEAVARSRVRHLLSGIWASEPVPAPISGLPRGTGSSLVYANVSPYGLLAVFAYEDSPAIYFVDLVGRRDRVVLPVEDWTAVGFYDDNIILVTIGMPVRECSLEDIWGQTYERELIDRGGPEGIMCDTDLSQIHERRLFYYATSAGEMYRYGVDVLIHERVATDVPVSNICPTTGIDVGWDVLFTGEGEGWDEVVLYGMNCEGETRRLFTTHADRVLSFVIPSSSRPKDVSAAVTLSFNGRLFSKERPDGLAFLDPLGYNGDMSLVRLYRDVFLMLDAASRQWFLIRLAVS